MGKGKIRDQTTDYGGQTTEGGKDQKSEGGIRRRWGEGQTGEKGDGERGDWERGKFTEKL